MTIHLPPLRERREDIAELAHYFLFRYNRQLGTAVQSISPEALELLQAYHWPGNVRELQNVIREALIVSAGPDDPAGVPARRTAPGRASRSGRRRRDQPASRARLAEPAAAVWKPGSPAARPTSIAGRGNNWTAWSSSGPCSTSAATATGPPKSWASAKSRFEPNSAAWTWRSTKSSRRVGTKRRRKDLRRTNVLTVNAASLPSLRNGVMSAGGTESFSVLLGSASPCWLS